MKPAHYAKNATSLGLYRALSITLGERGATDEDRREAADELRAFRAWLATTDAGHGLTAEPESAFRARVEAGVTAKMDGDAVVIRVSRKVRRG